MTHRALKICSGSTLQQELNTIRTILAGNGYPEYLISSRITKTIFRFKQTTKEGPQKCPVYLKLPWIGDSSSHFERNIKMSINNCFGSVQPRIIFSTRRIWPITHKDVLPTLKQSNVVYQYVCRCDSRYVGRTSQRLQDRINQHVPKFIRNKTVQERRQPERSSTITTWTPSCDSAIGTHLLQNKICADNYDDRQFSILSRARSNFHLSVLESIYITSHQPVLCRQK